MLSTQSGNLDATNLVDALFLQELKLSDQLFGLYVDVLETLGEWKHVSRGHLLDQQVSLGYM